VTIERRIFITGLISLVAAPAIVRAGSLMPVRVMGYNPPLSGKAIALMMQESPLFQEGDLIYRGVIIREYLRSNLFQPYIGESLNSFPNSLTS
jgi:hypothetical protein